jgi:hypothetical protein
MARTNNHFIPPLALQVLSQLGNFVRSGIAAIVTSDRVDSKVAKRQRIRALLKVIMINGWLLTTPFRSAPLSSQQVLAVVGPGQICWSARSYVGLVVHRSAFKRYHACPFP